MGAAQGGKGAGMNVVRQVAHEEEPKLFELTLDDFRTLHDAGAFEERRKVELIEGVLYEVAAQKNRHSFMKSQLGFRLELALRELGSPLTAIVEPTIALPPKSAPEPDIALTSDTARDDYVALETVALLIEVSSTTLSFDLKRKAALYARHGVAEYWVVDVAGEIVHRHWQAADGAYRQKDSLKLGSRLGSVTMPELAIDTVGLV
jgi:Uma2 family endonuclease